MRLADRIGELFRSRTSGDLSREALAELHLAEERIGYHFSDPRLLQRALTHRSFVFEDQAAESDEADYEAMEFLGDSILGLVVSEALYHRFPQREGVLSRIRAYLVSTDQLSELSRQLGLGRFIRLSRGEENTGGRDKRAILADLFESTVAAIYLDGGLEPTSRFLARHFEPLMDRIDGDEVEVRDYKSRLQEKLHSLGRPEPAYRVTAEYGPDHNKEFSVEVKSQGRSLGQGQGRSKKEAEQQAAEVALETLAARD